MTRPLSVFLQLVGAALLFWGVVISFATDHFSSALIIGFVMLIIGAIGYRRTKKKDKEVVIVKGE